MAATAKSGDRPANGRSRPLRRRLGLQMVERPVRPYRQTRFTHRQPTSRALTWSFPRAPGTRGPNSPSDDRASIGRAVAAAETAVDLDADGRWAHEVAELLVSTARAAIAFQGGPSRPNYGRPTAPTASTPRSGCLEPGSASPAQDPVRGTRGGRYPGSQQRPRDDRGPRGRVASCQLGPCAATGPGKRCDRPGRLALARSRVHQQHRVPGRRQWAALVPRDSGVVTR